MRPQPDRGRYNRRMDNQIAKEHERRNDSTKDCWDVMASHRDRVTQLVSASGERQREENSFAGLSLCVLGAGNCNDLDLGQLILLFDDVTLVDLDTQALQDAVLRQAVEDTKLTLQGGVDITDALAQLKQCFEISRSENESTDASNRRLDACIEQTMVQMTHAPTPVNRQFDVVCSSCVLTQLIDSVVMSLPEGHARTVELILAVRNRHLEIILEMTRPGGTVILISDFVSSATAPELANVQDEALSAKAQRWLQQGNFFTGTNPFVVAQRLGRAPQSDQVQLLPPWRWDLKRKQFAVFGCVVKTKR